MSWFIGDFVLGLDSCGRARDGSAEFMQRVNRAMRGVRAGDCGERTTPALG
jgi:hypothetical protein